jgi:beta-xylosidase
LKRVLFIALSVLASLPGWSQQYPKAILNGDYPDPSIIRENADYYMTHSPFYYAPGFLIWHSKDLLHWEPVCRAITEYKGSAMAPDLVKYKGKYYIYYPAAGTNWVVWADNIKGPWSKPIDLKVQGIDPGHIADEQGNRYLYVNEGEVIQLTEDGLATIDKKKKVYEGWVYPRNWVTECMCLESPKLNYHNGYYYMTSAEGGTAGPATSHMVVSARSKSISGPWENSPYNPIVHTYNVDDNWWSKGHGTLIDDVNGNWWMVYHAYANGYHTLGRQTLIEPIEWTSDGWFRTKAADLLTPVKPGSTMMTPPALTLSDDFKGDSLGLQWTFWKEYAPQSLNFKEQSLFVEAKGTTPANARLLLTTVADKNYETQVALTAEPGNKAGLMLYYNEQAFAGIVSYGSQFIIYKSAKDSLVVPNKIGKHFFVKMQNQGNRIRISVSKDGITWTTMIEDLDVSGLHHNKFGGFYALRIGLLSAGKGHARFQQFKYKNAVPQEKDMSAYLMVFHKDETHGLYMALSPDGYNFTALNNGKPVIAGDTIATQKGIRDPHIFRGPDGGFYLAMTDLHVFAKKDGFRDTEWERDRKVYGWGNNRGLVLMKSWDLVNWKRTNIRFDTLSAGLSETGCVWAPETIYDEQKGKLMIYFTMRFKNEANKLYYVYVNDEFNKIETLPQPLFQYPDPKVSAIDADITKVGDQYRMFYVSHDGQAGIKQAVSDKLNSDYRFDARWYDPEKTACEAPNVWKRIGENKWVLMYDVYGVTPHNFGFSETRDFVNFTDLGHFNEGVMKTTNFTAPKHGAIIHLTKEEATKLATHWGLSYDSLTEPNKNNPVLHGSYADPEILYAEKTKKYYLYPTSDGYTNWSGTSFKTFSSKDLKSWKEEGVILDLEKDVSWTHRTAWAPCIIEKKNKNGNYKYYYYFTAGQRIGVAVGDDPAGPFKDVGKPLIDKLPAGVRGGQNIDPDVFTDPKTGKTYLYWGNAWMAVCELNDDMVSIKPNTTEVLIGGSEFFSEGSYVFYRNGYYYFMWSKNDTRSPDYQVRYARSTSPKGPIDPSKGDIILSKDANKGIFATGHHSVLQIPGKDEWYIVYHRFKRPGGIYMGPEAGYNREVCIDKLEFNEDGSIRKVIPTL